MHQAESVEHQDSRGQRLVRHLTGLAVGALAYFAGKELGLSEPVAVIVGLIGALATSNVIGRQQVKDQSSQYPPKHHLDI